MDIRSLHYKYAIVAFTMAVSILIAAMFADYLLSDTQEVVTDNFQNRSALISRSRVIRNTIWQAQESLNQFLLLPEPVENQEAIHISISEAINSIDRLLEGKIHLTPEQHAHATYIRNLLLELDAAATELITMRLDIRAQYPSMEIGVVEMQPRQQEIFDLFYIILQNTTFSDLNDPDELAFYTLVVETRHQWAMTIIRVRLLIASRVGSFGQGSIPEHLDAIDLYLNQIDSKLAEMQKFTQGNDFAEASKLELHLIQTTYDEWKNHYYQLVELHKSPAWRNDIKFLEQKINPLFDEIWSAILNFDLTLEQNASVNIHNLTTVAQSQSTTIWLISLISFIFVILGYYSFRTTILRPVSALVRAFKADSIEESQKLLPRVSSTEFDNLVSAFSQMQNQVKDKQDDLHYQAMHDGLTGLANRMLLLDRIEHALLAAKRNDTHIAVILLDLDKFKIVNDTLGHQIGDELLIAAAMRLKRHLREVDTVARLGGDEFAVLLDNTDEKESRKVCHKIIKAFERAFQIEDHELFIGASLGVAIYPFHGIDKTSLIKSADIAMYTAKSNHLGYTVYDDNKNSSDTNTLTLANDLRSQILSPTNEISVVYQLKYQIPDKSITGAEALLRWKHPDFGYIDPTQIISIAEQLGIISKLTLLVLENAVEQCMHWHAHGHKIGVSVNISVYDLQSQEIIDHIRFLLNDYDLPAEYLTIEVTESAMMIDPTNAIDILNRLHDMGVRISVDDFGTGFSSLSYLKKMPVSELKIDKSFVIDMIDDENDAVIVKSIVDLAHNLGLEVIAEGVETQEIFDLLGILSCNTAQGFLLCKPVSATEVFNHLLHCDSERGNGKNERQAG